MYYEIRVKGHLHGQWAEWFDPLAITNIENGEAVLAGEQDFVISNGIDKWLGGIHLRGKESPWRWDDESRQLLVSL